MGKISASVLLKLFINGNETCYTTDAPYLMGGILLSNVNNIQSMIPVDQTNTSTQCCSIINLMYVTK